MGRVFTIFRHVALLLGAPPARPAYAPYATLRLTARTDADCGATQRAFASTNDGAFRQSTLPPTYACPRMRFDWVAAALLNLLAGACDLIAINADYTGDVSPVSGKRVSESVGVRLGVGVPLAVRRQAPSHCCPRTASAALRTEASLRHRIAPDERVVDYLALSSGWRMVQAPILCVAWCSARAPSAARLAVEVSALSPRALLP